MNQAGRIATTRRAVFAGAAGLAALSVAPVALAGSPDLERLFREADAIQALSDRVDAHHGSRAELDWLQDEWERRDDAFLDEVEALPCAPENAAIKARAVLNCYGGDLELMWDVHSRSTRDVRLSLQIVQALVGRV